MRAALPFVIACAMLCWSCSRPETAGPGWTRWRGPEMDGAHPARGLFHERSFDLEVAWVRDLGPGYSSVSVAGGTAVTMFSDGTTDWLVALDAGSGAERWRSSLGPARKGEGGAADGPLGTPVIQDGVVFALGAKGHLAAVALDDGAELWKLRIDERFGARPFQHGFASTPLVVGGTLVVQTGADGGRSTSALDLRSGDPRWSHGEDPVGYQSPMLLTHGEREQLLTVNNRMIFGLDPADGNELWRYPHIREVVDGHTQAVPVGDDRLLIHYINGSLLYGMLRGEPPLEELWRSAELKSSLCPPVHHEEHLYGFYRGDLICIDAQDGKVVWKSEAVDGRGLILVDDHLLISDAGGDLVVAAATPEGYEERARLETPIEDSYTWPTFAGRHVFLRDLKRIAAIRID